MVLALTGAVLGSACQTLVPLIARQIVDGVIVRRDSPLWPWLTLLVVVGVARFGFTYLRRYRGGRVGLEVQYDLRNAMHDHLQTMDLANLDRMPTGQLVARASSDSMLVQGLLNYLPIMSGNVLLLVLSLGVMFALSPLLAIVSLVVAPVLFAISYRMRGRVFPATWDGQQREGDVAQIVAEDVNGVRVVKAFGQEDRELGRVVDASTSLYGARMRAVRLQARYQPLLEAVPSIGQVAILAFGGWLALHHEITLGTFLAFSTYVAQFVAPARQLAGILTIAQQARAGVERIFQLLDLPPAIADAPDAVTLPELRGEITFADVHFGYGEGTPVLNGFDLHVAAGERVAIVGPSGAGKSTVAMLLSRFDDPDSGAVLVDGHDLRTVTLKSLRRQVGVAFEETFLFSDTVRANIGYGRPDATDDEIRHAARVAQAHGFIEELPLGYHTMIGERGLTLSGGQRQRIALARAVLADPRILILDDATSAIDAKVEQAVHDALLGVLANRTTLLVAHRRSTLHLADRIVVLDQGRVVEEGTHEELVTRSAIYRTLLSGLEEHRAEQVGDRIEALAMLSASGGADGRTDSAWTGGQPATDTARTTVRTIGAPSIGPGLGGGSGWRLNLAPTPELLARVAALPPVRDFPTVDIDREARHDRGFRLAGLLREFRRPLLVGLVLVILDALAGLAGPVLIKEGVDNGVSAGSQAVLFAASAIFLIVTLADLIDQVGETFVTGRAAERIMLSLRIRIWAQLQRLSLDYYEREMAGRIMTRMTTDVDQFESLIENGLLAALVSLVTFVGVGVALVLINTELGLCTLTVVVPLAIATMIFRRKAARLYDLARERIAIVNADFQESLSGVCESQAFTHENETSARFHRLGHDYLAARVAAQRLVATYFPFVQFLSAGADAIVLGVGAGLIASGQLTTGALIAFLLYIDMFFSPIQQLSQVFDSWQQTRVSVSRIGQLMRLDTLTPPAERPEPAGRFRGELALDGVRFSYPAPPCPPAKPPEALRGITLRIAAGETVAIVGQTGAGKSTVMKLLARFYDPDQGSVRVDGYDLRSLDLRSFRRQLGYVPQEGFLFTGTIRDNIAYGRPESTDAEVEAAARAIGAHDFIAALPGGYLHHIVERGRSLSAGQRQLVALARAELIDPTVLLLDEATSNLDLVTEARVAQAMQRVAHHRTTIVIAHRLQTARSADRIVVLARGQIAEVGSHEQLLAADGTYASMWRTFELVGGSGSRDTHAVV
ncbi:MAG TPA: ABC transporter ATP-binding protein [Pseudonocardiaceae bacterium]|nr:ABC transporter ATP-binding protein [Pseudonocardiaceae bacterium]